ncbi:MAG: phospho-N-acetylmuramoyl-pentapeptide-transferase [Candidatus Tokpelaia sp. JSC161]|jgi:phospho-N-acetylmuramoyl-pentapeptide-transferase|nr:MAG: phospho-N-acetylmuramoyl-pentapeptide-transferase [Candidatus Tokpelaia sp. JSC161]
MFMFLSAFSDCFKGVSLFQSITFRTGVAIMTSAVIVFLFGQIFINFLKSFQGTGQPIRIDGPQTHMKKTGTPTMGGLMILGGIAVSALLWCDLFNIYCLIVFGVTLAFSAIGFYDDYLKVRQQNHKGLSVTRRLGCEFLIASLAAYILRPTASSELAFPFGIYRLDLGYFFIPFSAFVIVGAANAVNFTDGLDGLAIVPVLIVAASFAFVSYIAGNAIFFRYLEIHYVPGAGELTVLLGALVGSGLAFLWFNVAPASIFMGDTGSLALGSLLGVVAVSLKHEILFAIIGAIFVIEALSVIIQVFCFKIIGRRVFLMAPLHHHFEKKGWTENQVVIRFWILSSLFAVLGLLMLNIR